MFKTLTKTGAAALALLSPLMMAAAPQTGTLRIEVGNVRSAQGRVHVYVCTQTEFLKHCALRSDAPARVGMTAVTVGGLTPGRYAVEAYLDENGNGKLDRALLGIPKEGVGFSNDARISLGPPKWSDAVFTAPGGDQTIRLRLRYFVGGDPKR